MKIQTVKVGYLETNCYILEKDGNVLIIDPGDETEKIIDNLNGLNAVAILITHNHFDHIGAVDELINKYDIPCYDFNNMTEGKNNIINFNFEVIFTPGHTDDSVSYYFYEDEMMFVGDFIFKGSIGRTDLPTGSISKMKNSIANIKKYNENITLYPGHGDSTVLAHEIKYNYYFN